MRIAPEAINLNILSLVGKAVREGLESVALLAEVSHLAVRFETSKSPPHF